MKKRTLSVLAIMAVWVVFGGVAAARAQISPEPIRGDKLSPKTIVWTIDDGPDETGPDGDTQMMKVARFLHSRKIPATFFLTGYPFAGQPPADSRSLIARGVVGTQPQEMIRGLIALGHRVGNHTQNHLVLTELLPSEIWYELMQPQVFLLDGNQNGFYPLRTPGLHWTSYIFNVVGSHPYLSKMTGPIDQDAGGQGYLLAATGNGVETIWIGGDWDCQRKGFAPSVCGALYVNRIREITEHGSILLMHVRTEYMSGKDGSGDFPLRMTQYIVDQLTEYQYVPLESMFGVYPSAVLSIGRGRPGR